MSEASPRGSLLIGTAQVDLDDLARSAGAERKEVERLVKELEAKSVFSRDPDRTIFSRRMRRDEAKAERDKANGKTGGNPALKGSAKPTGGGQVNQKTDGEVNPPDKAKKLEARSQKESAALPSSVHTETTRARDGKPETLEQKCRKIVGEEPVSTDHAFVFIGDLVGTDGITEGDVIAAVVDAMADATFRIKHWKQLINWVRKAAQNRLGSKPKTNGAAPPDTLDPAESTRPVDMGSGVVLEEKTLVKMIRSTFDLEMPNRMAFYNFMLKDFDKVETFRRGIEIKAPHLMKFFPPSPDPAEPALAVGR